MSIDPRTKLCLYLIAVATTLATRTALPLCGFVAAGLAVVVAHRSLRRWAGTVRLLLPMLVLLTVFSAPGGTIEEAVGPALKLLALGTLSTALFAAVSADELADTFTLLRLPASVSFVLLGGLRYAPMMAARWADLLDARRARGTDIPRGIGAAPVYASLLVPAIVRALRTADETAEAMEARGFGAPDVTLTASYRLRVWDWTLMMLAAVSALLSVTHPLWLPRIR